MNQREKVLAGLIVAIVVVGGAQWWVKQRLMEPLRAKDAQIAALDKQIEEKTQELFRARDAEFELRQRQQQSLPADLSTAQTLYQKFLQDLLTAADVSKPTVTTGRVIPRGEFYNRLPFTVRANFTLKQLIKFLFGFYQSGLLHQARQLSIKPQWDSGKLTGFDVTLGIEALALKDAVATTELPKPLPPKGKPATLEEFLFFVEKNPFQPTMWVAPDPPKPPPSAAPPVDERADIYVTGLIIENGVGKLWLENRKRSQKLKISQGEELKVPGMTARLGAISPPYATLVIDGKEGTVRAGGNLASWTPIPTTTQ